MMLRVMDTATPDLDQEAMLEAGVQMPEGSQRFLGSLNVRAKGEIQRQPASVVRGGAVAPRRRGVRLTKRGDPARC